MAGRPCLVSPARGIGSCPDVCRFGQRASPVDAYHARMAPRDVPRAKGFASPLPHVRPIQVPAAKYARIIALQRQVGNRATALYVQRWDPGPLPGDQGMADWAERNNTPPASIEVTVIDDSDLVGWLASFTRTGEVYMTDVRTMTANVRRAVSEGQKINRLNILDHGNTSGVQIGTNWITTQNLSTFTPLLSSLRTLFTSDGFVHLQHCEVGQNQRLMVALAQAFGVPVYGGTGAHNPVYRFNFGDYVRANPDGTFIGNVSRP